VILFSGPAVLVCTEGERAVSTVSLVVVLSVNQAHPDHSGPDPDSSYGIGW